MPRPSKHIEFSDERPGYKLLNEIVQNTGGWLRTSGPDEESVEVWHEDTEYIFRGKALICFLYAVKDNQAEKIDAAKDLIEYIERSAKVPPSVFVRDAIVQRAHQLKAKIEG